MSSILSVDHESNLQGEKKQVSQSFALFRLSIMHPEKWALRFGKILYPEHGVVDVLEPSEHREALLTIMWRPYQELFRYHSPRIQQIQKERKVHSKMGQFISRTMGTDMPTLQDGDIPNPNSPNLNHYLEQTLNSYRKKVRQGMETDFRNFELISEKKTKIDGHFAIIEEVSFRVKKGLIRKFKAHVHRKQVYLVCFETKRLIILHTSTDITHIDKYKGYFEAMLETFRCH